MFFQSVPTDWTLFVFILHICSYTYMQNLILQLKYLFCLCVSYIEMLCAYSMPFQLLHAMWSELNIETGYTMFWYRSQIRLWIANHQREYRTTFVSHHA
jgi:hypothetical protein